eukprot:3313348-Prymnesium_polylepis.1
MDSAVSLLYPYCQLAAALAPTGSPADGGAAGGPLPVAAQHEGPHISGQLGIQSSKMRQIRVPI